MTDPGGAAAGPSRRPSATPGHWRVEQVRGSAAAFHARDLPDDLARTVWVLEVDRPAIVLGSAQPEAVVDRHAAAAAGVEIVRRRSGGGAVLLVPDEVLWVDVLVPVADPLWEQDVGRSAWWLGAAWASALVAAEPGRAPCVHRGAMVCNEWSALACFAGIGPGEVVVGDHAGAADRPGSAKLVGISQRRTRAGARFQCALYRRSDALALPAVLALGEGERAALAAVLDTAIATDIGVDALIAALPS